MASAPVLQGGFLRKPELLRGIIHSYDRDFYPLYKSDVLLSKFLTPTTSYKKPLASTTIIETLVKARDKVVASIMDGPKANDGDDGVPDPLAELCLDNHPTSNTEAKVVGKSCGWKRTRGNELRMEEDKRKRSMIVLPKTISVEVDGCNARKWVVTVLTNNGRKRGTPTVAIEATAGNFQQLFDIVQVQIAAGERRPRHGASRPPCEVRKSNSKGVYYNYKKCVVRPPSQGERFIIGVGLNPGLGLKVGLGLALGPRLPADAAAHKHVQRPVQVCVIPRGDQRRSHQWGG